MFKQKFVFTKLKLFILYIYISKRVHSVNSFHQSLQAIHKKIWIFILFPLRKLKKTNNYTIVIFQKRYILKKYICIRKYSNSVQEFEDDLIIFIQKI